MLNFLVHVGGYSRVQVKRLAKAWLKHGQLRPGASVGNGFTRKYTDADRRLLAELDELHNTLAGPATKKLCERAWHLFDLPAYALPCRYLGIAPAQPEEIQHLHACATSV